MDQISVSYHYDAEQDIFSAWLRQPGEVVSTEVREGIVVRMDANTEEFVGYTVIDLSRQFRGIPAPEVTIPFAPESSLQPLRAQIQAMEPALASVA